MRINIFDVQGLVLLIAAPVVLALPIWIIVLYLKP